VNYQYEGRIIYMYDASVLRSGAFKPTDKECNYTGNTDVIDERDSLFMTSVESIVEDIMLNELKENRQIKTIAVVSALDDDGKSEISDYLSFLFAQKGEDTLLLNLDNIEQVENLDKLDITHTRIKNLDYLQFYGKYSAKHSVMDKNCLKNLFKKVDEKYRRVIIDTVSLSKDMSGYVAASAADSAYFICNRKNPDVLRIKEYYQRLLDVGTKIHGVVFNNVKRSVIGKRYYNVGREII
jgi:Mrp family chromosome partitioning ATPase